MSKTVESTSLPPLILLNPRANRGQMDRYRSLIQQHRQRSEAEYVETKHGEDATCRARQAAREGRPLVVIGGDGSINAVVNGILTAERKVPLGIVPAGSGNDFAYRALLLPRNPAQAVERALYGEPVAVDVGKVNDHYFVNAFSVGLDADIAAGANAMKKVPFMSHLLLYYAATLRQLLFGYHRCPWLTYTLDSDTATSAGERRYVLLAVSNGPAYGGGFLINPSASPHDGLLNVCSISYVPLIRALRFLPAVQKGKHAKVPEVTFQSAQAIRIEAKNPINMQVDGETTMAASFEAHIIPGALWIRK